MAGARTHTHTHTRFAMNFHEIALKGGSERVKTDEEAMHRTLFSVQFLRISKRLSPLYSLTHQSEATKNYGQWVSTKSLHSHISSWYKCHNIDIIWSDAALLIAFGMQFLPNVLKNDVQQMENIPKRQKVAKTNIHIWIGFGKVVHQSMFSAFSTNIFVSRWMYSRAECIQNRTIWIVCTNVWCVCVCWRGGGDGVYCLNMLAITMWYVLHTHAVPVFEIFCIISFSTSWINICNHKCICVYVYSLFKNRLNLLGVSVRVREVDEDHEVSAQSVGLK